MSNEEKKEPDSVVDNTQKTDNTGKGTETKDKTDDEKSRIINEVTRKLEQLKLDYKDNPDGFRKAAKKLLAQYSSSIFASDIKLLVETTITQVCGEKGIQGPDTSSAQKEQAEKEEAAKMAEEAKRLEEEKFIDGVQKSKEATKSLLSQAESLNESSKKDLDILSEMDKRISKGGAPTEQDIEEYERIKKATEERDKARKKLEEQRDIEEAQLKKDQAQVRKWKKEVKDPKIDPARKQELEPKIKEIHDANKERKRNIKNLKNQIGESKKNDKKSKKLLSRLGKTIEPILEKRRQEAEAKKKKAEEEKNKSENKADSNVASLWSGIAKQPELQEQAGVKDIQTSITPSEQDAQGGNRVGQTQITSSQLPSTDTQETQVKENTDTSNKINTPTDTTTRDNTSNHGTDKTSSTEAHALADKMINGFNKHTSITTISGTNKPIPTPQVPKNGTTKGENQQPKDSGKPKNGGDKGGCGR